jgi:hypothetical protein
MLFKRCNELVGAFHLRLKRCVKNRKEQQYYFDGATKTIKSERYKDRSLNIEANGGNKNFKMRGTNSRWW